MNESHKAIREFNELPLQLEPDDEDDDRDELSHLRARRHALNENHNPQKHATEREIDSNYGQGKDGPLRWALDALQSPAMAAADWLARDIDPTANTVVDLLANPAITLQQVRQAKSVYKTMRIVGEKSADRRIGARMYVAAIAAGLVRHKKRISAQSDSALKKGLQELLDDRKMPQPLRDLAGMALCVLNELPRTQPHQPPTDLRSM